MKVAVDTNILVRVLLQDEPGQNEAAARTLQEASLIAISLPCLCEFVWLLRRGAKLSRAEIAEAIRTLIAAPNVVVDRGAVDAGLAMLDAGGDFADGVLAHQGRSMGGETFVTFDRRAIAKLNAQGIPARLPS